MIDAKWYAIRPVALIVKKSNLCYNLFSIREVTDAMYAVAVCEDQKETKEETAALCSDILAELGIEYRVAMFSSADELEMRLLTGERFDLLCLDIIMDGRSGMELARKLRMTDDRTSIVFLTGSSEFLKDGYEVRPIQYLFKPVTRAELKQAIETDLRLNHRPKTFSVKAGGRTAVLPLQDIRYVESRDHGSLFHVEDGEQFYPLSLTEIEGRLPAEQFCRCHNSFLVNLTQVREVSSRTVSLGDLELTIGRKYAKRFKEQFVRYLNEQ